MVARTSDDVIEDVGVAAEALTTDDGAPLHQIESLCMRCGQNGMTRLLLTRIPHFREVLDLLEDACEGLLANMQELQV